MNTANIHVTSLRDNVSELVNVLIAYGPGGVGLRMCAIRRNESSIRVFGERYGEATFEDAISYPDLVAKADAALLEMAAPTAYTPEAVTLEHNLSKGDKVTLSDPRNAVKRRLRVMGKTVTVSEEGGAEVAVKLGKGEYRLRDAIRDEQEGSDDEREIPLGLSVPLGFAVEPGSPGLLIYASIASSLATGVEAHVSTIPGQDPAAAEALYDLGRAFPYPFVDAQAGVRHYVRLRAYDRAGNRSDWTDELSEIAGSVSLGSVDAENIVGQIAEAKLEAVTQETLTDARVTKAVIDAGRTEWDAAATRSLENTEALTSTVSKAEYAELSTRGQGIRVNYSNFVTPNPGELYMHGFDLNGQPADIGGHIVVNGENIPTPPMQINPNTHVPKGFIMFSKGTGRWYLIARENGAWRLYNHNYTNHLAPFVMGVGHYIIGEAEMDGAENFTRVDLWTSVLSSLAFSQIYQDADQISLTVAKLDNPDHPSQFTSITLLNYELDLRVKSGELVSSINLSPEEIRINSSKLIFGNLTNLAENGAFEMGNQGWGLQSGFTIQKHDGTTPPETGSYYLRRGISGTAAAVNKYLFSVKPGESYSLKTRAICDPTFTSTGTMSIRLQFFDEAGSSLNITGKNFALVNAWTDYVATIAVPNIAGIVSGRLELAIYNQPAGSRVYFNDAICTRMADAELIVDGTIKAQHMAAAFISADEQVRVGNNARMTSRGFSTYTDGGTITTRQGILENDAGAALPGVPGPGTVGFWGALGSGVYIQGAPRLVAAGIAAVSTPSVQEGGSGVAVIQSGAFTIPSGRRWLIVPSGTNNRSGRTAETDFSGGWNFFVSTEAVDNWRPDAFVLSAGSYSNLKLEGWLQKPPPGIVSPALGDAYFTYQVYDVDA